MAAINNTQITSGQAGHTHTMITPARLSRRSAAIRYGVLAGLSALLLAAAPARVWSSPLHPYNSSYGYGAGTSFDLSVSCSGPPNCVYTYPYTLAEKTKISGGDGQVSTSDSSTLVSYGGSTASGSARADAATGQLGSYGSASATSEVIAGGVATTEGQARSDSEFYNTYTLVGPAGSTPTINLAWNIHGLFSHKTGAYYGPDGSAALFVTLLAPKYEFGLGSGEVSIVDAATVFSADGDVGSLSGTLNLGAAYSSAASGSTLTVGDSFTLDTLFRVINGDSAGYKMTGSYASDSFASDFLHTAGLTLTSSDPNVTIQSATDGLSAVPIPAAVWLFGSGLVGLVGIGKRRRYFRE